MPQALQTTEKQLQAAVVNLATMLGFLVYHPFDSRRSTPGYPDLTLARRATETLPGRLLFVELKRESGYLSKAQVQWLCALRESGAEVHVVRPSHLQEFAEILRKDDVRALARGQGLEG